MRKIYIVGIVLSLSTMFTGCAIRPIIIKDSDKVYVGKAGQQPPTPDFDWALLSISKFKELTE